MTKDVPLKLVNINHKPQTNQCRNIRNVNTITDITANTLCSHNKYNMLDHKQRYK